MYAPGPKHPWIGLLVLIVIRFVASGVGGTVTYREIQKWYRLSPPLLPGLPLGARPRKGK
jgi:hypothetical protein